MDPFIRLIFMAYFYFLPRKKWWKGEARDLTSEDRRNVDKVRGGSSRWESGLVATFVWNAFEEEIWMGEEWWCSMKKLENYRVQL